MRLPVLALVAVSALSACETPYVESQQGVGFGDYQGYSASQLAREADARRTGRTDAAPMTAPVQTPDRVDVSAIVTTEPVPVQPAPVTTVAATQPVTAAPTTPANNGSISDEQDFSAVAARETIESDKARIESNKANYQQVPTTALPERPANDAAAIVEFALSTTNNVGEGLYRRSAIMAKSRFDKNCAKYPSQDKAQEAFLSSGGPQRDPKGIDPDGDGFACYWDPAPFRSAKMGASVAQPVVPPLGQ